MDKTSLKFKTLKNASFHFVSYVWPIIFSIIITPIIVLKLGVEQYGLFLFINTVSGLVGIITSGVDNAAIREIARAHSTQDTQGLKRLIQTLHSIFIIIGISGFLIIVGGFLIGTKTFPQESFYPKDQLLLFFIITALTFLIQTALRLFQIIPSALQRFDINSIISMTFLTLATVGNAIIVLLGFGIKGLFFYQLILAFIISLIWIIVSLRLLPLVSYSLNIHKKEFMTCIKFGTLSSINEFARTSLISLDRLLIPLFGNVSQLTYYSVPGNLAARIPATSDNLSGIIFPTATHLHSLGQNEKLKSLYMRSSRLITTISLAITIGIIFNAESIMRYWLDESFAQNSTHVLIILAITNLVFSLLSPVTSFFMGMNKMKINTLLSFLMAGINISSLFFLLPKFGIVGAAWAYLLSVLPIFIAIFIIENHYLKLKNRFVYYVYFISKHGIVSLLSACIIVYLFTPFITNFITLAFFGPLSVVLYLVLYGVFRFFEKEDTEDLISFVQGVYAIIAPNNVRKTEI